MGGQEDIIKSKQEEVELTGITTRHAVESKSEKKRSIEGKRIIKH